MPVVEVDPDELRRLAGHEEKSEDELKDDLFALGLEFEGETADGEFQLEFAPDRLDRLSVEGVARSLRYQYGDSRGVHVPSTNDPEWTIEVDESVPETRPYVTGAVVRGVDLDESALESLIQLQEKLHATIGRGRAKGAIGVHDLTMLKGASARVEATDEMPADPESPAVEADDGPSTPGEKTVTYRGVDPDGDTFVALEDDAERTPAEVLTEHPTGREYAEHVTDGERYPAIYDDLGLFSFPPVINSRRTEVTTDTRDLFVELTGTDQWTIDRMCAIVCYALAARGGQVEAVLVDGPVGEFVAPDFEVRTKRLTHERVETTLGVDLDPETVVDLCERSGLDAEVRSVGDDEVAYDVGVPPYRTDVLHPVDLVDDVGRAYGFNDLVPRYPDVSTIGSRTRRSRLEEAVRTRLVGLGFEDLLNFHLTNAAENFERMGLPDPDGSGDPAMPVAERGGEVPAGAPGDGHPVVIEEPYSGEFTVVRTWALPSVVQVLENNTHRAYPQDLAEVGFAAVVDEDEATKVAERRTVAAAVARHDASYEDAKARLQALCRSFDADLETPPVAHPSFVDGRAAWVEVDGERAGVVGELHPAVLVEHDLEVPVAAFEFDLAALGD